MRTCQKQCQAWRPFRNRSAKIGTSSWPPLPSKNLRSSKLPAVSLFYRKLPKKLREVKNTGFAILHAAPELRADREIALTSVRDRGFVLRYLDDSLKATPNPSDSQIIPCSKQHPRPG